MAVFVLTGSKHPIICKTSTVTHMHENREVGSVPPHSRVRELNHLPKNLEGEFVLYWMTACRRFHHNAALERCIQIASEMGKPVLVVEPVAIRHKWSSDRILTFLAQGMIDNLAIFEFHGISYLPWIETHKKSGDGLLRNLSRKSCAVVIDDYPTYLPKIVMDRARETCFVSLEAVDSNGIIPMSWAEDAHLTAYSYRKHVQRSLVDAMFSIPKYNPMDSIKENLMVNPSYLDSLFSSIGAEITPYEWMWRLAQGGEIGVEACSPLDIDHSVGPVESMRGGRFEALIRFEKFLQGGLDRYDTGRNDTDDPATSGLSPWIHFGHISSFEIVLAVLDKANWDIGMISFEDTGRGSRSGWWGLPEAYEGFLDQIITWRELGFNFAHYREDHNSIHSIPAWAKKSLNYHANDERLAYTFEEIEQAMTDDEVWNAAQRQLLRTGHIHNYLRMVWGKRILEWAPNPETAAEWMIIINDKWALDGRDPNSYTGIFWVLGRHDRAWGPERPIFGKVRYMSSSNTKKKLRLDNYLAKWAEDAPIPKSTIR